MTAAERRAVIVERERLARELRRCDTEAAQAMNLKRKSVWLYWARRRDRASRAVAELDARPGIATAPAEAGAAAPVRNAGGGDWTPRNSDCSAS